jgi:hypothetical protein
MNERTSWIATVEPDHTVKAPAELAVGEKIMLVRLPASDVPVDDPERRARFAATHAAARKAIEAGDEQSILSNEEIVALVKRARRPPKDP